MGANVCGLSIFFAGLHGRDGKLVTGLFHNNVKQFITLIRYIRSRLAWSIKLLLVNLGQSKIYLAYNPLSVHFLSCIPDIDAFNFL